MSENKNMNNKDPLISMLDATWWKISILPAMDIFEERSKVFYYKGEESVKNKWPEELLKKE